jgi:hypothetical protein
MIPVVASRAPTLPAVAPPPGAVTVPASLAQTLASLAGRIVEARLIALLPDGGLRLSVEGATVDMPKGAVLLPAGTALPKADPAGVPRQAPVVGPANPAPPPIPVAGRVAVMALPTAGLVPPAAGVSRDAVSGASDPVSVPLRVVRVDGAILLEPVATRPAAPETAAVRPSAPMPTESMPDISVDPAVARATAQQGSVATFFADLAVGARSMAPGPLRDAVMAVLDNRLDGDAPIRPETLAVLVARAVDAAPAGRPLTRLIALLRARLAEPATLPISREPVQPDLPADDAPALPPARPAPPPPHRTLAPRGEPALPATLTGLEDAAVITETLLARADAAEARGFLHRAASLPDLPQTTGQPRPEAPQGPAFLFEIPMSRGGETSVLQFIIEREPDASGETADRIWQARFALDLEPLGPVRAHVRLAGDRVSVTLSADRPETRRLLAAGSGDLETSLRAADLDVGRIGVQAGATPATKPRAGLFADRLT